VKFIHTADLHFGCCRTTLSEDDYLKRPIASLMKIFEKAVSLKIETLVIAGDLFDRSVPSKIEKYAAYTTLTKGINMGLRILLIRGNHDEGPEDSALHELVIWSELDQLEDRLIVVDTEIKHVNIDGQIFVLAPFKRKLTPLDISNYIIENDLNNVVVVMHMAIRGSMLSSGIPLPEGNEIIPNERVFYWAMGDIHERQQLLPNAHYSGSPYQIEFGETDYKGVLLLDTNKPIRPEFVAIEGVKKLLYDDDPRAKSNSNEYHVAKRYVKPDTTSMSEEEKAKIGVNTLNSEELLLKDLTESINDTKLDERLKAEALEFGRSLLKLEKIVKIEEAQQ